MDHHDKVCIVTGANAGIGKAAAIKLAGRGVKLVLACRNLERGQAALDEIVEQSGNKETTLLTLDTSSLSSVRSFVKVFEARFDRLDVLINNAGNFDLSVKRPQLTSEGLENVFATNYLGPWLLTLLLLKRLKSVKGRVLNVGSKGLMVYPWLGIELDNLDGSQKYSSPRAYYHSKLALLSFTHLLSERTRHTGLAVNAIRVPAVQVDDDRLPDIPAWQKKIYKIKKRFSITPQEMADTYVWLALAPEAQELQGQLIDENQKIVSMPKRALDIALGQSLFDASAHLAHYEGEL